MPAKFLAFGYDQYCPGGGCGDCVGIFDSLAEAEAAIEREDMGEVLEVPALIVHHRKRHGRETPCGLMEYAAL